MKRFLLISISFLLFFSRSLTSLDPDFGWHLQSGQYILKHGIPSEDIFTYTAPSFKWINHEWLHDIIIASLFNIGGYTLLAVVFAMLWVGVLLLASRRINWLVGSLASLALFSYVGTRPMVWSLLFFALLERMLERKSKYNQFFLPILFLIWANLHGGFFLGLIIMVVHMFFTKKIVLATLILSFLATFINPYGTHLYQEISRTLFDGYIRLHVHEWQPFIFNAYAIFYIALFVSLCIFVNRNKALRYKFPFIPLVFLVASLMSTRNTPIFIISSLRYFEKYLSFLLKLIPRNLKGSRLFTWRLLQACAIGVVAYGLISSIIPRSKNNEQEYPQKAVNYLREHPCQGNIFNNYDYGGYLIWKVPGQKVYIDGRMPSWPSESGTYLQQYLRIYKDHMFRKKEFYKYSITCALLKKENKKNFSLRANETEEKLVKDLLKEGWKKKVEDEYSVLLISPELRKSP